MSPVRPRLLHAVRLLADAPEAKILGPSHHLEEAMQLLDEILMEADR